METLHQLIQDTETHGIGGGKVAALAGISRTTWHRWRTGQMRPTSDNLQHVADTLAEEARAVAVLADRFARLAGQSRLASLSDTVSDTGLPQ